MGMRTNALNSLPVVQQTKLIPPTKVRALRRDQW